MMQPQAGKKEKLTVEKISLGGDGICRLPSADASGKNFVVFVPYTLSGEECEVRITDKRKSFARGKIARLLKPAPERISPPCPYYFSPQKAHWCGGCNFQHLNYAAQLKEKENLLKETLAKIGGIPAEVVQPPVGAAAGEEWRYRNKIQIPFAGAPGQKPAAGFFAPGSHMIVPIEDCLIQPEEMMAVVRFVREKMERLRLPGYDERGHRGWLRNLIVRRSLADGRILITFVTLSDAFPGQEGWREEIRRQFPLVSGICQNVNPERSNVIVGRKWKTLWGEPHLIEALPALGPGGAALKLKVSAPSFFQVNAKMAERLYGHVARAASEGRGAGGALLDLYCGVGGIALACAPAFKMVAGADEVASAVSDARENAALNKISNCRFLHSDVRSFLRDVSLPAGGTPEMTVVLDPPRAGCAEDVLDSIVRLRPGKILYVSCEPSTLARDLARLAAGGYRTKRVTPFDLFPQSSHIESVAEIEPPR